MCRSPSARTVALLRSMWLMVDLPWVMRSFVASAAAALPLAATGGLPGMLHDLARDERADGDAAAGAQLLGRVQRAQRLDRGARDVHRVRGAVDLREDVVDAGGLEDGANGTTGDDAGALGRRLQ